MRKISHTFLGNRFLLVYGGITLLFVISFYWSTLFVVVQFLLVAAILATLLDFFLLHGNLFSIGVSRPVKPVLSLSDPEKIVLQLTYNLPYQAKITLIDEVPHQLEMRDMLLKDNLVGNSEKSYQYTVQPVTRGEYHFGKTHIFMQSFLGLLERKLTFDTEQETKVYPSTTQMKQFEMSTLRNSNPFLGIKKMRRIGQSYEFEQIRNYVSGDDYRSVNWKATGRANELMVNQFQDEKSQSIYFIIDKGRSMKLPFGGMSLLDYSINTTLAAANIALKKGDRVGLITVREQVDSVIKADSGMRHLRSIHEALYKEQPGHLEPNFEMLYTLISKAIRTRSLFFFFTNMESENNLMRNLPLLRSISKRHLLVVVNFENSGLAEYSETPAESAQDVYFKVAAKKRGLDKKLMLKILRSAGINAFLTQPKDLSSNTINKYLELKSRGLI